MTNENRESHVPVEVTAGVHQLRVPIPNNPVGFVLPYLFEVPGGCSIIDPGWNAEESIASLRAQMASIGAGFSDLKQIIVTHVHPDHYGMAGRVREESGAQVLVHEAELSSLNWRPSLDDVGAWLRQHGMPAQDVDNVLSARRGRTFPSAADPDSTFEDGETLHLGDLDLQVMWTPGHAPGHACFYAEDREVLFSGDHILPTISPNVSYRVGTESDPLGEYRSSLNRLRGLRVNRVLPAHEYSFDDLDGRIDELEAHHESRLQEMIDAIEDGASTAYEVARRVAWAIGHFDKFNDWTKQAAMGETLAHLNHLVNLGRIRSLATTSLTTYEVS